MAEEQLKAGLLTGYKFFPHPENPTLGILRLDTREGPQFVMVEQSGLRQLAEACLKHADELEKTQ